MNKYFSFIVNRHQEILRYVIVILAAVVIAWLFPRQGIFKYDFEVGKPWTYEDLIAPFDFSIKKTDEEIAQDRDQRLEDFKPHYRFNEQVAENRKAAFLKAWEKHYGIADMVPLGIVEVDSAYYAQFGVQLLEQVYGRGIMQLNEEHKDYGPNAELKLVKQNNVIETARVKEMLSMKQAHTLIRDSIYGNPTIIKDLISPLLEKQVVYNVTYDDTTTQKFLQIALEDVSETKGVIQKNQTIISRGEVVTDEKYQTLLSYRDAYEEQVMSAGKSQGVFIGNLLITLLAVGLFALVIRIFSPEVFYSNRKILFLFLLIVLMLTLVSALVRTDLPVLYAIPFCIVPIILRPFFGPVMAFMAHFLIVLLTAFIVHPLGIEYTFLQFAAGMVAILANTKVHYWSRIFLSCAYILGTYWVGYFAVSFVEEGSLQTIDYQNVGWLAGSVLLTILAYPLIPLFEKTFGFISEITLMELSDINKPLLKDLSLKAPGTFQHSLQVANLSEAAAAEIGANTLLVKVGALYHDIGKMEKPLYFVENQKGGVNPHDDLEFEDSARIIIGHVIRGVEMAKRQNLPDILIDFIRTHHGTTRVEYFYRSFLKNYPDKEVDEEKFTYPGPLPYSKETAILMMADSVEAASRSMKNPSDKDIENLVDKLVDSKIEQNQFVNSNITFREISAVKKVLKKMLNSIYHVRVAYPEE